MSLPALGQYNLIEFLINLSSMKRPQSAKPGHKGQWGQSSVQDISQPHPHHHRKQVRIMKPDMTTHDFARILPRRIQQDKERLYSEALQLKQALHEVTEQNVRLKTKISVIEREKDKLNRFVDTAPEGLGKGSRLNAHQRPSEKDNMIIRNLKKLVRQCRQENEGLRLESQKIKKMMKYTKINELEVERKVIIDENKRLSSMLQQYSSQFVNQQEIEQQNEQLKKYLEQEMEEKNQIDEEREKYEQIIESLEDKIKSETQKHQNREKKLAKDLNSQKRRVQDLQRKNDQLYRELKSLRENQQFIEQRQKNMAKPNIRSSKVQKTVYKVNTQQSEPNIQSQKRYNQIKRHNQQLQKELEAVKEKLRKAESEMSMMEDRSKVNINQSNLHFTQEEDFENYDSPSKPQQEEYQEDEYEEVFEKEETKPKETKQEAKINESRSGQRLKESKEEQQIEKYKKDFQQNEEEEELYKKEEKPKKGKHADKSDKKKEKKGGASKVGDAYKPNKKLLAEIKELLTYRMKSQRYPFSDIKSDIESAETNQFSYSDLCNMLVNQPFYLTSDYTRAFLSYCFEKERVQPADSISSAVLVGKLRKVIDDFELMEENEEKEMIIRIAEMTSTYPRELQVAFENIKNGEETVGRQDLIDMFKKLELEDKYIDLIIAQLSLCSDDLQHLNFHGFFQRFYIEDQGEQYMQNNAIEQQESEQSYKHSSRVKKQPKGKEDENSQHNEQ